MVAEDSTGRQGEISQLSTVRLNLDFVDWGFVNLGAVVTAKLLDHPELTPREYVTFLLANAYFYADALRVGADEDTIHYTRGEFMRYPPIKKNIIIRQEEIVTFDCGHTMELAIPNDVVSTLKKSFGNLEGALSAMQVFMDENAMAFLHRQGDVFELDFGGKEILAFPFVRTFKYIQTGYSISELHPERQ